MTMSALFSSLNRSSVTAAGRGVEQEVNKITPRRRNTNRFVMTPGLSHFWCQGLKENTR
jgi:hypothetical protein